MRACKHGSANTDSLEAVESELLRDLRGIV